MTNAKSGRAGDLRSPMLGSARIRIAVVIMIVGIGAVLAGCSSSPSTSGSGTTSTTAATTTTTTAPAGPKTSFVDGTYPVGAATNSQVAPGTYLTKGGSTCYWERLSGLGGATSDIIANDLATGQAIATIAPTDAAFKSTGCATWSPLPATGTQATSMGDGTWAVGIDIAPGTYSTSGGDTCYWARLSGFEGGTDSIIANDLPKGSAIVSIAPTDKGFATKGCGTWTKTG